MMLVDFFRYAQSMFVTLCDYGVSVLSYVIVSVPVFQGKFDNLSGAELSALISRSVEFLVSQSLSMPFHTTIN